MLSRGVSSPIQPREGNEPGASLSGVSRACNTALVLHLIRDATDRSLGDDGKQLTASQKIGDHESARLKIHTRSRGFRR